MIAMQKCITEDVGCYSSCPVNLYAIYSAVIATMAYCVPLCMMKLDIATYE